MYLQYTKYIPMYGSQYAITMFFLQESLIEGILEDDFVGSDIDATLAILHEFSRNGHVPRHVKHLLRNMRQFYKAIN